MTQNFVGSHGLFLSVYSYIHTRTRVAPHVPYCGESCSTNQVTLNAGHTQGHLNVVANMFSRLGQIIPTEWGLQPKQFWSNLSEMALA